MGWKEEYEHGRQVRLDASNKAKGAVGGCAMGLFNVVCVIIAILMALWFIGVI